MGFARAQPILPRCELHPGFRFTQSGLRVLYKLTRPIIGEPLENEGIPRAMVPVMAPRYSAESSMRCGAFAVRENLRCKLCRD